MAMNCKIPVLIVGTGGLARSLVNALMSVNYPILGVVSRASTEALQFIHSCNLKHFAYKEEITTRCICFLAVPDQIIPAAAQNLNLSEGSILIHCAGSVDMQTLSEFSYDHGVFYPVQTFHPSKTVGFSGLNVCLEASSVNALKQLEFLSNELSCNVLILDSQKRMMLHISAIFACNFSNLMYSISEELLNKHNIEFSILYPLILETAHKILHFSPTNSQTGPASRNDLTTIAKHINILDGKEKAVYKMLSDIIRLKHDKV